MFIKRHLIFNISDILKIDNLQQFPNLVKLQLDNNIIEKIEGLSSLVNLEWLGVYWMRVFIYWLTFIIFEIKCYRVSY